MSRIGKKPIIIPKDTEVTQEGNTITVKGPKGELSRVFRTEVDIKIEGDNVTLLPTNNSQFANSLWGTYGSHLKNMVLGDSIERDDNKKLEIQKDILKELIGRKGITHTVLATSGVVIIDGEKIDVISKNSFIEKGIKVIIADYKNNNYIAKIYKESSETQVVGNIKEQQERVEIKNDNVKMKTE